LRAAGKEFNAKARESAKAQEGNLGKGSGTLEHSGRIHGSNDYLSPNRSGVGNSCPQADSLRDFNPCPHVFTNGDSHANQGIADDDDFNVNQLFLAAPIPRFDDSEKLQRISSERGPASGGFQVASGRARSNMNVVLHNPS
jgi:hypothetical protein